MSNQQEDISTDGPPLGVSETAATPAVETRGTGSETEIKVPSTVKSESLPETNDALAASASDAPAAAAAPPPTISTEEEERALEVAPSSGSGSGSGSAPAVGAGAGAGAGVPGAPTGPSGSFSGTSPYPPFPPPPLHPNSNSNLPPFQMQPQPQPVKQEIPLPEDACETLYIQNLNEKVQVPGEFCFGFESSVGLKRRIRGILFGMRAGNELD